MGCPNSWLVFFVEQPIYKWMMTGGIWLTKPPHAISNYGGYRVESSCGGPPDHLPGSAWHMVYGRFIRRCPKNGGISMDFPMDFAGFHGKSHLFFWMTGGIPILGNRHILIYPEWGLFKTIPDTGSGGNTKGTSTSALYGSSGCSFLAFKTELDLFVASMHICWTVHIHGGLFHDLLEVFLCPHFGASFEYCLNRFHHTQFASSFQLLLSSFDLSDLG